MAHTVLPSRSPVHHQLSSLGAQWGQVAQCPIALHFGEPEAEAAAARTLGLCDQSALPKLGLKGPGAAAWLTRKELKPPKEIYDSGPLPDGGLVMRNGTHEFFLESGFAARSVPKLAEALGSARSGVHRVERQDATFVLCGERAWEVLAQTCGVNVRDAEPGRLVLTRVAVVSCGILPQEIDGNVQFRLWVDPSTALYLWETLAQITEDLGGRIVGAASCGFPADA